MESDLCFLGLLIFENRLKPESSKVISRLQNARIRNLMITGMFLLLLQSLTTEKFDLGAYGIINNIFYRVQYCTEYRYLPLYITSVLLYLYQIRTSVGAGDNVQTSIAIARECHLLHGSRRQVLVELAREPFGDCSHYPDFTFTLLPTHVASSLPSTTSPACKCAGFPADSVVKVNHVCDKELEWDVRVRDSGCCVDPVDATASSVGDGAGLEMGTSFLDSECVEMVLNGPTFDALQKHRPDLFQLVIFGAVILSYFFDFEL